MLPVIDHAPECADLGMSGEGGGGTIVKHSIRFLGNQRIGAIIFSIAQYRSFLTVKTAAGTVHVTREGQRGRGTILTMLPRIGQRQIKIGDRAGDKSNRRVAISASGPWLQVSGQIGKFNPHRTAIGNTQLIAPLGIAGRTSNHCALLIIGGGRNGSNPWLSQTACAIGIVIAIDKAANCIGGWSGCNRSAGKGQAAALVATTIFQAGITNL